MEYGVCSEECRVNLCWAEGISMNTASVPMWALVEQSPPSGRWGEPESPSACPSPGWAAGRGRCLARVRCLPAGNTWATF